MGFYSSLDDAIPGWGGRDRVSPLFEIHTANSRTPFALGRLKGHLIYLGPVTPAVAQEVISRLDGKNERAWLTYGLYNFVIYVNGRSQLQFILKWANQNRIRWEHWLLNGASLVTVENSPTSGCKEDVLEFASLPFKSVMPELRDAGEEFQAVLATTAGRCGEVGLADILDELKRASRIITTSAADYAADSHSVSSLTAIATLVDANAAISRFASQMFAGISPIVETECHFWTHSLLGTGVANLALIKIRRFITRTLGEARIPDQVEKLRLVGDPELMRQTLEDGQIWNAPWLQDLPRFAGRGQLLPSLEPICPLITYLSGRDGFHTTQSCLSAPLNILTSCSSLRWSLLTITHEMSHRVVDEVLGHLLPDISKGSELDQAVSLLREERKPANLLECLRLKLLDSLLRLNATEPVVEPSDEISQDYLADLISARGEEVEEIMVHVFDFIYFYGSDPKIYVPSIWHSWDAIPRLHRRLPSYILRTLCAALAAFWTSPTPTQDAFAAVMVGMELVSKKDKSNVYIRDGLTHLKTQRENLLKRLWLRRTIIGIVRTFMQSPVIVQAVLGQSIRRRETALSFDGAPIENPLRFIERHTSAKADAAISLWLLARIAFDSSETDELRLQGIHK